MKDVLSVVTFIMGALCFVLFLILVKPDALSAVPPPGKPAHGKLTVSREPACRTESEWRERIVPDRSSLKPSITKSTNEVNL